MPRSLTLWVFDDYRALLVWPTILSLWSPWQVNLESVTVPGTARLELREDLVMVKPQKLLKVLQSSLVIWF
jgi:hypothetical protein